MSKVVKLHLTESELLAKGIQSIMDDIAGIDSEMEKLRDKKSKLLGKVAFAQAKINELEKGKHKALYLKGNEQSSLWTLRSSSF